MSGTTPTWDEYMARVLNALTTDDPMPVRDLRHSVINALGLTADQVAEQLGTGQSRVENRIGWAISHLLHHAWRLESGALRQAGDTGSQPLDSTAAPDLNVADNARLP